MRRSFAILALLLAGCSLLAPPDSGQFPEDCARLGFSEVKCRLIVSRAATQAGVEPLEVSSARFVSREPDTGVKLGGTRIAVVALTLVGGEERVEEVWCTGISNDGDRICHHDPHIRISQGIDTDVPCPGEPPDGCATPPPTPRPASVRAAIRLELPSLDVSLDHIGSYEIEVGEAGLPDGTLSERRATLMDAQPTTFWINDGIRLEVRPTEPGRPPVGSIYRDPYDGVELVRVFLVFDVVETSPGAVLQVRDILVR